MAVPVPPLEVVVLPLEVYSSFVEVACLVQKADSEVVDLVLEAYSALLAFHEVVAYSGAAAYHEAVAYPEVVAYPGKEVNHEVVACVEAAEDSFDSSDSPSKSN